MSNNSALHASPADTNSIVWPVARNFGLWALLHSLTASAPAKEAAERAAGTTYRNGLYRLAYNALAWGSLALMVRNIARVPDRELYLIRGPIAFVMRLLQLADVGLLAWSGLILGPLRFNGVPQVGALLRGRMPQPEDEAQGPIPGRHGGLKIVGPFRVVRHPANWAFALVYPLSPRMTVKGATLAVILALYSLLGSLHEDIRLGKRYGRHYEQYRREVPFLVPRFQRRG